MSATYTDGFYTIYGSCGCGQTYCVCGSVKYYPAEEAKSIPFIKIFYPEKMNNVEVKK